MLTAIIIVVAFTSIDIQRLLRLTNTVNNFANKVGVEHTAYETGKT